MPLVSVILPVFNAEPWVGEAVASILRQTLDDLELIVVDDGSTDRSAEVVRSFSDPRLRLLREERNGGHARAMNRALGVATGRYVARMDADDVSEPERLRKQVALMEERPELAVTGTRRYLLTPRGMRVPEDDPQEACGVVPETWERVLAGTRLFPDPSIMARRPLLDLLGGFRTYLPVAMDTDLLLRLLEGRAGATLLERLYGKRLVLGSVVFRPDRFLIHGVVGILARERHERGTDAVMRGEPVPVPRHAAALRDARRRHVEKLWAAAGQCLRTGDRVSSLAFARRAARTGGARPSSLRSALRYLRALARSRAG